MKADELYDYLLLAKERRELLVLTFDDDDQYQLSDTDLCFSFAYDGSRETEPLLVDFAHCLNDSHKRRQAFRDGELKTPGVYWTSIEPIEPVKMEYQIDNVKSVFREDKNYFVFDRNEACD